MYAELIINVPIINQWEISIFFYSIFLTPGLNGTMISFIFLWMTKIVQMITFEKLLGKRKFSDAKSGKYMR